VEHARRTRLHSLELGHRTNRLRRCVTGPIFALDLKVKRPSRVGTVVIAGDDAGLREALAEVLSRAGHRVMCAESGQVALDTIDNHQVDVLILEVRMPTLDGWGVLRHRGYPPPYVIVCTATELSSEDMAEFVGIPPFGTLTMPVSATEIVAEIDWALLHLKS
jgi:DNA-binding response OmpR family regulator